MRTLIKKIYIYICARLSFSFVYLQALKEDSVFVVTSKRSTLDKCRLPMGIRLFVSAGHSESDLLKASGSLKRVAALVLAAHD